MCCTAVTVLRLAPLLFMLALTNDPGLLRELEEAIVELHAPERPPAAVEVDA